MATRPSIRLILYEGDLVIANYGEEPVEVQLPDGTHGSIEEGETMTYILPPEHTGHGALTPFDPAEYEPKEKRGAVADFNHHYQQVPPEGSKLACPDCGSVEGRDTSWRYVDGHYEHACPNKHPQVGHYQVPARASFMGFEPEDHDNENGAFHLTHTSLGPLGMEVGGYWGKLSQNKDNDMRRFSQGTHSALWEVPTQAEQYRVPFSARCYEVYDGVDPSIVLGELFVWFRNMGDPNKPEAGTVFVPAGQKPLYFYDPAVYAAFPRGFQLSPLRPPKPEEQEDRTPSGQ